MTTIDLILAVAVLAAIAGAIGRNLTSGVLLASFAVSTALCKLHVEFNAALWIAIDVIVIGLIFRPQMKKRDWLILALFPLAVWPLYVAWPKWLSQAVDLIVAAQMMLTFPAEAGRRLLRQWARFNRDYDPWDMRAYA